MWLTLSPFSGQQWHMTIPTKVTVNHQPHCLPCLCTNLQKFKLVFCLKLISVNGLCCVQRSFELWREKYLIKQLSFLWHQLQTIFILVPQNSSFCIFVVRRINFLQLTNEEKMIWEKEFFYSLFWSFCHCITGNVC